MSTKKILNINTKNYFKKIKSIKKKKSTGLIFVKPENT